MRTMFITIILMAAAVNSYAWCYYDSNSLKEKCNCKSSPAKEIRESEKSNIPCMIEDEIKDEKGDVVSLVMFKEYPSFKGVFGVVHPGGITQTNWFKTQKACQEARRKAIGEKNTRDKESAEADKKRLKPYE